MKLDLNIQIIDCDTIIKESVCPNEDGSYTIFINARHTAEQQHVSYLHAIAHILNGDFEKENVNEIEINAHRA